MLPSEVRQQIYAEHAHVLALIKQARDRGTVTVAAMAVSVRELVAYLLGHIEREEDQLVPLLRENSNWAAVNEAELREHHEHQRRDFVVFSELLEQSPVVTTALTSRFDEFLRDIEQDVWDENKHMLTPEMIADFPDSDGFGA